MAMIHNLVHDNQGRDKHLGHVNRARSHDDFPLSTPAEFNFGLDPKTRSHEYASNCV